MEKIKVCAYCRVSTNSKDQANSYENQKSYFEREITKNENYELVGIYPDKGISGTKLKRPEFEKMLFDAGLDILKINNNDGDTRKDKVKYVTIPSSSRKPKFNLILVKNTSRFARNVLVEDILRDLRRNKVYVHFLDLDKTTESEEDITFIQLFQTFDERESRDKSKKVKFGFEEGKKRGKIHSNNKLYGYTYDILDNKLKIIDKEAKVIKRIYNLYSEGLGIRRIINILREEKIKTRNNVEFGKTSIRNILQNEKYAGFNNRLKYDTGTVFEKNTYAKVKDDYDVLDCDKIPAIIEPDLFYKCRDMLQSKVNYKNQKGLYKGVSEIVGKIMCKKCGNSYTSNVDKGRKFFNCSTKKTKGTSVCDNKNVSKVAIDKHLKLLAEGQFYLIVQFYKMFNTQTLTGLQYYLLSQLDQDNGYKVVELNQKLNTLNDKRNKLTDLFLENSINKDYLIKKTSEIEKEIQEVTFQIEDLSKSNRQIIENVRQIRELIDTNIKLNVPQTLSESQLLEQIESIVIYGSNITYSFHFQKAFEEIIENYPAHLIQEIETLTDEDKKNLVDKYDKMAQALA